MSLLFIDTETTGFSPTESEIIEIALIDVVFEGGKLKIRNKFETRIKPARLDTASPKALEVNGYTEEGWRDAPCGEHIWPHIRHIIAGCKRPIMAGHNVHFDLGFLRATWDRWSVKPPALDYRTVDTYAYALPLMVSGKAPSMKLTDARDALGLDTGRAHSAMADAMASFELAQWALGRIGLEVEG